MCRGLNKPRLDVICMCLDGLLCSRLLQETAKYLPMKIASILLISRGVSMAGDPCIVEVPS